MTADDELNPMVSTGIARFVLVPAFFVLLLASGVYWLRQLPDGSRASERSSTIQVQIVQHPDATPIPVTAAEPSPQPLADRAVTADGGRDSLRDEFATVPAALPSPTAASHVATPDVVAPLNRIAAPNETIAKFQQSLFQQIHRQQRYPSAARHDRLQGVVRAVFSMRRDGTIAQVWVKTSSGASLLDEEAVQAIRRAAPLPAIPPGLPDQLNIELAIAFEPT